jgi:hypothetical protein
VTAALAAHIEAMTHARAHGELRTIHGHRYPVSAGELQGWLREQAERNRAKIRAYLQSKAGARHVAERAFA